MPAPIKPRQTQVRPKPLRTFSRIPKGPRLYSKPVQRRDFPGEPPPGFLVGELHGSRSEWPIYAATWKALGCTPDDGYLRGPWVGDQEGKFFYQNWQLGGRSKAGGAVVDFVIPASGGRPELGIRIQSYRFHLATTPDNLGTDAIQRQLLSNDMSIIDVYEQDYLHLKGSALVVFMKQTLGLIQRASPITATTARQERFRP
jgi:hypothetical protein